MRKITFTRHPEIPKSHLYCYDKLICPVCGNYHYYWKIAQKLDNETIKLTCFPQRRERCYIESSPRIRIQRA